MGNALNEQGMSHAAIEAFKQAVGIDPLFTEAFSIWAKHSMSK